MKIDVKEVVISKSYADLDTGQVVDLRETTTVSSSYFTIRKLNARIHIMGIENAMESMCSSKQDIYLFWKIVDQLDKQNEFRQNVSTWSTAVGVSLRKTQKMLTAGVACGFLKRTDRGVYVANPYAIKSKGASNEYIESLQHRWGEL